VAGLQAGRGRSEVGAQAGDVGLQGLPSGFLHVARPERVHQSVDADRPALGERQ
jgi:hypothetical protein